MMIFWASWRTKGTKKYVFNDDDDDDDVLLRMCL